MNNLEKTLAINLRRVFRIGFGYKDKFETTSDNCDYFGQEASDLIRAGLEGDAPFAVSRFGHSELRAVLTYLHVREQDSDWKKLFAFIKGDKVEPWWSDNTIHKITHNAGVFPVSLEVIERFCELTLKDIPDIDVLGSWLGGERWIKGRMPHAKFMRFHDFYHFLHERPWTTALKDRKVLVVHPFERSIQHQYQQKEKIFSGVHQLPDFKLITHKAVQSIAGNQPDGFNDWFEALGKMQSDISTIDFDIAILGCGAYGMPLAVYIKNVLKRKAIHLGGNVQFLFGIKGSRWENDPVFKPYINEYWLKPMSEETPKGHQTIDSNCYW